MAESKNTYKGQTEARRKATAKYLKESVEDIRIRVPKGKKETIQDYARSKGKSLNSFVNEAIDKEMGITDNAKEEVN